MIAQPTHSPIHVDLPNGTSKWPLQEGLAL